MTQHNDRLDVHQARTVLNSYGIRSSVTRGRVYVGEQRVPLRRNALAAMLGIDATRMGEFVS